MLTEWMAEKAAERALPFLQPVLQLHSSLQDHLDTFSFISSSRYLLVSANFA